MTWMKFSYSIFLLAHEHGGLSPFGYVDFLYRVYHSGPCIFFYLDPNNFSPFNADFFLRLGKRHHESPNTFSKFQGLFLL